MYKFLSIICLYHVFLVAGLATAADSVVVVPLGKKFDANLTAGNIKKGVEILGVTGNLGIAWGCRYSADGTGYWNGSACDEDCRGAAYSTEDCHIFCSSMSSNLLSISSGATVFCNGSGGK